MSKAQDEISELMDLQRQAARKPSRSRKKAPKKKPPAAEPPPESDDVAAEAEPAADAETEGPRSEIEQKIQELSDNIEEAVAEIEEAAKDQPFLTSIVAFTLGLVIGQSLTRR